MIETFFAILAGLCFLLAVGCFVAPFLTGRFWTLHNRTTLARVVERYKAIGP